MNAFQAHLAADGTQRLCCQDLSTIQVNITLRCNQCCSHCHLACSPERTEEMSWQTMERVIDSAGRAECDLVDITGGAPELHPHFRRFVSALRSRHLPVQVHTNLTVMLQQRLSDLPLFLADHDVALVASLPCYLAENVDAQRGEGVHSGSIDMIRRLNAVGYGREDGLQLNLVYNPGGAQLPPAQALLEDEYRRELRSRFGIAFSRLLTFTNMPVGRFRSALEAQGAGDAYMDLLSDSFNPETVQGLMCRHQVSVGWDGTLYDCDFNLALGDPVEPSAPQHIRDFDPASLAARAIVTAEHCLGCSAGSGSSCRGALI